MKILYVSQYFPPEPGAPAARVSELSAAWARQGHDVTVLTGMPHHPTGVVPEAYRGRALVRERFGGVDVVRTPIFATANRGKVRRSLGYASFAASALAWGQLHVPKPDVLVATSPQFLCAVAGGLVARLRGVPFVFEVRDLWPESLVAVGSFDAGHPLVGGLELLEKALYADADAIVVVTDSFEAKLVARGVDAAKLAVVKNGVDLGRFVPGARETKLRERLGFGDAFVAAYVGTHGLAHGLGTVLDVAAAMRDRADVRFLFVGDGAERQALEARAKAEGLERVTFLGSLPRDAMNEVYETADVCLVPLRRTELFSTVLPSKIFEIMAMARPIVLAVDGEARALVERAGGGVFVPPEDAAAMRAAIERLAADRALGRSMGAKGREFVVREFDRDALASKYVGVLEAAIARARGAR